MPSKVYFCLPYNRQTLEVQLQKLFDFKLTKSLGNFITPPKTFLEFSDQVKKNETLKNSYEFSLYLIELEVFNHSCY